MVFLFGCSSLSGKSSDNYIKNLPFNLLNEISPDKLCYIASKEHSTIRSVNGIDRTLDSIRKEPLVTVKPGVNNFMVEYNTGTEASSLVRIHFTFTEGKNYLLDYEITRTKGFFTDDEINFFFSDLNDPVLNEKANNNRLAALENIEKIKAFMVFSQKNSEHLEGTWYFEDNYPYNNNEIIFSGNKFVTTSINRVSKVKIVAEGEFFYNEEFLVLIYSKKNGEPVTVDPKEIVKYKLESNKLITGNFGFAPAGLGIGGEYKRK